MMFRNKNQASRARQRSSSSRERQRPEFSFGHQLRSPALTARPRLGFTLVELLVVIAIIGILSTLLLGVAAGVATTGRVSRTKGVVDRIHTLVMQQYDTYRTRRAVVNSSAGTPTDTRLKAATSGGQRGAIMAESRLYALRELMMLEMPDRWSDVWLAPVPFSGSSNPLAVVTAAQSGSVGVPRFLASSSGSAYGGPTPLNEAYRREYARIARTASMDAILANQGAECLYMTVMFATADGEARGLFAEYQIGDTDGDGAYEFLDGWGNPVEWLRWPAGFVSSVQSSAALLGDPAQPAWVAAAGADHDPFDLYRSDPKAFRLVPLIFSAGQDERYGVFAARGTTIWNSGGINPYRTYAADPGNTGGVVGYLGTPVLSDSTQSSGVIQIDTEESTDNITYHLITAE